MSTEDGIGGVVSGAVAKVRDDVGGAVDQAEQLDMLEPFSSEEMLEARERVGPYASRMAVTREAREARKGRPKGARNKRTDDLVAYLSQFGPDPAVAAMKIIGETEELMVERSKRRVMKVLKGGKDRPDKLVEVEEETMTLEAARSMRMRMIEAMLPYWHGKKPVQVDVSLAGAGLLVIEGLTHDSDEVRDIVDAEFIDIKRDEDAA